MLEASLANGAPGHPGSITQLLSISHSYLLCRKPSPCPPQVLEASLANGAPGRPGGIGERDESLVAPLDLECSICLDGLERPVQTPCNHWFCRWASQTLTLWVSLVWDSRNPCLSCWRGILRVHNPSIGATQNA